MSFNCNTLPLYVNSLSSSLHRTLPPEFLLCTDGIPECGRAHTDSNQNPSLHEKRSSEIIADEKKFIMGTYDRAPMVLSSGKGCKLYDVEGQEYLDLTSGIIVNALGCAVLHNKLM